MCIRDRRKWHRPVHLALIALVLLGGLTTAWYVRGWAAARFVTGRGLPVEAMNAYRYLRESTPQTAVVQGSARLEVLHCLRQQQAQADGRPNLSLADYVAPAGGPPDWLGAFAVSTGFGADELAARFQAEHDDYNSIMTKALADRLAEALAEHMHRLVRRELWGYAPTESLSNEDLIRERYRGIRPAPGYPACPDHTEKRPLFRLLDAERSTGITLTENFAMHPAAAVSGWYFSHPTHAISRSGR